MNDIQTYNLICKSCQWTGERIASASDQCPRCRKKLQLAPEASRSVMRQAINNTLHPPHKQEQAAIISRTLRDKDAPKDEGDWEFKLSNGVLEVIAYNDEKTEAQVIRLVRRGMQIHLMQTRETEDDAE